MHQNCFSLQIYFICIYNSTKKTPMRYIKKLFSVCLFSNFILKTGIFNSVKNCGVMSYLYLTSVNLITQQTKHALNRTCFYLRLLIGSGSLSSEQGQQKGLKTGNKSKRRLQGQPKMRSRNQKQGYRNGN